MTKITIDDNSQDNLISNAKKNHFGPISNRKSRDLLFLLLFIAYWIGMAYVARLAFLNGDWRRIYQVADSAGYLCGYNNSDSNSTAPDYSNRTFLYFIDPISLSTSVCLQSCPTETAITEFSNTTCIYGFQPTSVSQLSTYIANFTCSAYSYKSSPVLNVCLPDISSVTSAFIGLSGSAGNSSVSSSNLLSTAIATPIQVIADLQQTWPLLVGSVFAALLLSFIWLFVIQWFGAIFVWATLIGFNVVFTSASIWLYYYWKSAAEIAGNSSLSVDNYEVTGAFVAFILVSIICALFLIVTIALIKKIQTAVNIIKEACKAVHAMPLIIIFPLWIWAFNVLLFLYFVAVMMLLLTMKLPITFAIVNTQSTTTDIQSALEAYHVFGFLWTFYFLIGINCVSLAGAFASWYFTLDKSKLVKYPALTAFMRTLRYHLGSIAIGSILLAIISFFMILLHILRRFKASKNFVIQWLICCCLCLLSCLKAIVKFINKNAYIMIAIKGESFCKAAASAMGLLVKNAVRLVALNVVSFFILLISKLGIAALVAFGVYILLDKNPCNYTLHFSILTVILCGAIALFVAIAFLGIFGMAIDTIFLCFLEDCEHNDGSPERPFFMSDSLKQLVNKTNMVSEAPKVHHSSQVDEY